jgi:hypothetical protein
MADRLVFRQFAAALAVFALLLTGCREAQERRVGATNGGPVSAVNITASASAGGTILGGDTALNVALVGTSDGGAASSMTIVNDAGNSVPSDTTGADLALNSRTFNAAVSAQGVLIDAGTHQLVAFRGQSEGTAKQYFQIYCGQTVTDAGGTNGAGTAPDYQIECPGGNPCDWSMPSNKTCGVGATYYWSTDAGFLSSSLGTGGSGFEAVWR